MYEEEEFDGYEPSLGPLTIHEASTGELLRSFHDWAGMSERVDHRFAFSWSPDSSTVLVVLHPNAETHEKGGSFWLCGTNGDASGTLTPPNLRLESPAFSPCGRFLHWEYVPELDENAPLEDVPHYGRIATAIDQRVLYDYDGLEEEVLWSPKGDVAIFTKARFLLTLPDLEEPLVTTRLEFGGLHRIQPLLDGFHLSLSPCGQPLVGVIKHGSQNMAAQSFKEIDCQHGGPYPDMWPALNCVWQARLDLNDWQEACVFSPIEGLQSFWLPKSIAWHPCPGSHPIYAIADTKRDIFLIDAWRPACLKKWRWKALLKEARPLSRAPKQPAMNDFYPFGCSCHKEEGNEEEDEPSQYEDEGEEESEYEDEEDNGKHHEFCLSWSPDGSQLAISCAENLLILTFGPDLV